MKFILGLFFGAILTIGYNESREIYFIYKMESARDQGTDTDKAVLSAISSATTLPDLQPVLFRCFIGGGENIYAPKCKIARKTFTFITGIDRPYWTEWNNK
jgi:hypothetical protein